MRLFLVTTALIGITLTGCNSSRDTSNLTATPDLIFDAVQAPFDVVQTLGRIDDLIPDSWLITSSEAAKDKGFNVNKTTLIEVLVEIDDQNPLRLKILSPFKN